MRLRIRRVKGFDHMLAPARREESLPASATSSPILPIGYTCDSNRKKGRIATLSARQRLASSVMLGAPRREEGILPEATASMWRRNSHTLLWPLHRAKSSRTFLVHSIASALAVKRTEEYQTILSKVPKVPVEMQQSVTVNLHPATRMQIGRPCMILCSVFPIYGARSLESEPGSEGDPGCASRASRGLNIFCRSGTSNHHILQVPYI